MSPQLTVQQLEHAIKNFQARVDAKTLECVALKQLLVVAPDMMRRLVDVPYSIPETPDPFWPQDAIKNYLSAKFNQAVIDLEELKLQLRAIQQRRSGIVLPGMVLNQKPHQG